jgi:RNA polymerase sigma-70 factor (ECF subfamily)
LTWLPASGNRIALRNDSCIGPATGRLANWRPVPAPFYLQLTARMLRPMRDELADSELMLRYRDGDKAAFEELYERHRLPLYRFLFRQLGNEQSCDDVFQEVWSKVIRARHNYRASARFTTYLYRIARNSLIDHFRRAGKHSVAISDARDDVPEAAAATGDPAAAAERSDQREALLAALAQLPDEQREAFLLREEAGCGLAEIAEITGVGHETVKSRLRYALLKLRKSLGDGEESG